MGEVLTENVVGQEVEQEKVLKWRLKWLLASGYSSRNADLLASSSVNLHFACEAMVHAKEHGYDDDYVIKLLL
jgi:hypothetical protein